jgi:hypothetical protein
MTTTPEKLKNVIDEPKVKDTVEDQPSNKFDAELMAILKMPLHEYEQKRKTIAKTLNVRVSFLDKQRLAAERASEAQGETDVVENIEPWPEAVDGDHLLSKIVKLLNTHVVLPKGSDVAISLWIMLTYCYDQFRILPILGIISPQKRCGKTTLLEIIASLSYRALPASNISSPAVFRSIDKFRPTLLVDEADSFLKGNEELRGVLNSGHTKSSAYVIRCDGDDNDPKKFSTWGPKAIAAIGKLPGTISDRAILVKLKRKAANERREKIGAKFDQRAETLRRMCLRWALDHVDDLLSNQHIIEVPGNDRATDNWAPIATIAGIIGGNWLNDLRKSAKLTVDAPAVNDDLSILLLEDIHDIFSETGSDRIFSANLVNLLNGIEERPWCDLKNGHGLTTNVLARFLAPFDISSKKIRIGIDVKKGYMLDAFDDAFNRYIPIEGGIQRGTREQNNKINRLNDNQKGTKQLLFPFENSDNNLESLKCSYVPFQRGGAGEDIPCSTEEEVII